MKNINPGSPLLYSLLSLAALLFLAACGHTIPQAGAVQPEPQVMVVTATPTAASPRVTMKVYALSLSRVVTATPTAASPRVTVTPAQRPIVEWSIERAANPAAAADWPGYLAGSLLKGKGEDIFYLAEDGARRRVYDQDTFSAFGFTRKDIVALDDELLATIPLSGELTRLVFDDQDNLYWVLASKRWQVNEWRDVVSQADYIGLPTTPLDELLAATLPMQPGFERGVLLREDRTVYYFDQDAIVPVPMAEINDELKVVDVPAGVLAAYEQKAHLERVETRLKHGIPAANVRQGPDLQYAVIGTVENSAPLSVRGQTEAGDWLQVTYQNQTGWVAAQLVKETPFLNLLAVVDTGQIAPSFPQAEPAAVIEDGPPQPFYCPEVPIRGFGQVWGDHPEIQPELGCPYSWNGGEQGAGAAVQTFEHGLMVWLEADSTYNADPVYVFFDDGVYQRFGDLGTADPAKVGTVPAGFFEVGDKFSKVYWEGTGARVKERLGYATTEANDSPGAYQEFYYGRMFWVGTIDRIFVVLQYTPDYQPTNKYYAFRDCFELSCQ